MILETIIRNNIGTFTNGPFNPREDPIGAMINFVGCAPGNVETIPMTRNLINLYRGGLYGALQVP